MYVTGLILLSAVGEVPEAASFSLELGSIDPEFSLDQSHLGDKREGLRPQSLSGKLSLPPRVESRNLANPGNSAVRYVSRSSKGRRSNAKHGRD
jgi:hypothetical protein